MHIPVLLKEVLAGLRIKKGDRVIDATLGGGGYLQEFCKRVGERGEVFAFDRDSSAITAVKGMKNTSCSITFFNEDFKKMAKLGLKNIDKIAFDLGFSTVQLEKSGRGFSFLKDEPLLMTYQDVPTALTAKDLVNTLGAKELEEIFKTYGGESYSRKIAEKIVEERKQRELKTTYDLVGIVRSVVKRKNKIHPATKVFQALRIAVNDEIDSLKEGLASAISILNVGGRVAAVSFHSGEDRIVKNMFREYEKESVGKRINKKPITPTAEELKTNPKSRSAKLRVFEKIK